MAIRKRLRHLLAVFTMVMIVLSLFAPVIGQASAASYRSRPNENYRLATMPKTGKNASMAQVTNYCDYSQKTTTGDVAAWLASAPAGTDIDCIDIWIESQGCGYLDIRITDDVLNLTPNVLRWTEGAADLWSSRQSTFPITFPEDYNGGSVNVTVVLVAAEYDYVEAAGADALLYWSGNEVDQTFTIDTDCQDPVPVNYCSDLPPVNSIYDWLLQGQNEGANVDCLNVGVPVQACGALSIPFENLTTFGAGLYWVEGTDLSQTAYALPIAPGTFAEDYNGGTIVVTVYIGTPESDYVVFAGADAQPYAYYNGGEQFTIDTDCIEPETNTVLGCSQGFYKNNYDLSGMTLGSEGFTTPYASTTSLFDVLNNPGSGKKVKGVQTYDGYTRQQVTAYLNSLYIQGYELDTATILAGGYDMATLEYYNHGATGDYVIADCPLD